MTSRQVSKYIISSRPNKKISERTLNLLLYYSAKEYYLKHREHLFTEPILKVKNKSYPVVISMMKPDGIILYKDVEKEKKLTDKAKEVVDSVIKKYGSFTTQDFVKELKNDSLYANTLEGKRVHIRNA